jgi:predicted transcriptional regulator
MPLVTIAAKVERSDAERLQAIAQADDRSTSYVLRAALKFWLAAHEVPDAGEEMERVTG